MDSGRLLITMVHTHIILSMNPLAKYNTRGTTYTQARSAIHSRTPRASECTRARPRHPREKIADHLVPVALRWSSFREKSKITLIVEKTSLSAGQGARHTVSGGLSSGVRGGGVHMSARGLRVPPSRSAHALDRCCRGAGAGCL